MTMPNQSAANPQESLAPLAAHDSLGFAELEKAYNLLNISSYGRVLSKLIVDEISQRNAVPSECKVLDIGCGCGVGRDVGYQRAIRHYLKGDRGDEYWGIEPDEAIQTEAGLFDQFQHALMETAELPENYFDLAYSSMVMEHVADPAAFLMALSRCLKPGGVYLFATPNARSFVPWASWTLHKLKLDEVVLRLIRGKEVVEEYHYPLQFRFNIPNSIAHLAALHNFQPPRFIFLEGTGAYSYFRGPLKVLKYPLLAKRKLIQRNDRLATLIGRLQRSF